MTRRSDADRAARCGNRWETTFHSERRYAVPCADVRVRVAFRGPGGAGFATYAFWDGGGDFRVRAAFPTPGDWTWQTTCTATEDAGLHGRSGQVRVSPAQGRNPLRTKGYPRVSDDRRSLCFADGTPLLWVGDTAWAGPFRATPEDWTAYLKDRVAKRFTVVQVALTPDWAGEADAAGIRPFVDGDIRRPVPAFWRGWESRVQEANDAGLVVLVVGLMEPQVRYPTADAAAVFTRFLVGRLHGDAVIFSPSFDSNFRPLADQVGEAARDATQIHLITQHPGTPSGQSTQIYSERYFDRAYLDFCGVQSGHNGGNRERCARQAVEWNLHLYRREPHKPVVNLEAMYDTEGRDRAGAFTADDARSLGWRSFLSGAAGYTYGTDLYQWRTDPAKPDFWKRAMRLPGSRQMTHLHDFFAPLRWWTLVPAPERVREPGAPWTRRGCFAVSADGRLGVAYLPAEGPLVLDGTGLPSAMRARWFDPRAGRFVGPERSTRLSARTTFDAPGPGDWVLRLRA